MSKVFNHYFFKREEVIQDIKDNAEDYSRPYSVQALMDIGGSKDDANKICDNLEEEWDMRVDYLAEQQRENEDEHI